MKVKEFEITTGDTLDPLGVQLKQRNAAGALTPVDLSTSTLKFRMVHNEDELIIHRTSTGVTIITAATGFAQFQFSDIQVAVSGIYWGFFIEYKGGKTRTFPTGRKLKIIMNPKEPEVGTGT
jgi:hypothetical protein